MLGAAPAVVPVFSRPQDLLPTSSLFVEADPFELVFKRLRVAGNLSLDGNNPARINVQRSTDAAARLEFDFPANIAGTAESQFRFGRNTYPSNLRFQLYKGTAYSAPITYTATVAHELNTAGFSDAGYRVSFLCAQGQQLAIGGITPNARAVVDIQSTTMGLLLPRLTTTQRDAQSAWPAGMLIYNSSLNKVQIRVAAAWETVTSA